MNKTKLLYQLVAVCLLASGCVSSQVPVAVVSTDSSTRNAITQSPVFEQSQIGFALYDLEKQESLVAVNANKYFIPASNAKLYTFYAGLCMLGDSVPALRYVTHGDSLIFWGTGDPSLLHPDLPTSKVLPFLKDWKGKLFWANTNGNNNLKRYGSGWSWDDYNDYYQAEITQLPIYGNIVRFETKGLAFDYSPNIIQDGDIAFIQNIDNKKNELIIRRDEHLNKFEVFLDPSHKKETTDIPFITSDTLALQLLTDTLKRDLEVIDYQTFKNGKIKTLRSLSVDTIYKRMLQQSDNMLAEQVMILCASQFDSFNVLLTTKTSIDSVKARFMADLPDKPIWVDGSGLSRYNLVTPRTTVKLLEKIYQKVPQQRLFDLLPTGGKSGTIKGSFKNVAPFVFAKSGSFSNTYNISGYLRAKSGKILIFSCMNNNFTIPTSEIRKEVERILNEVREKY
jgi:serine-type D-Ala-D-Ala carboxypeptidase/endopeptidase (penicillin-binding protein 4)